MSPAAACALEPLLQRIGEQEAEGRPWVVSAAELRKLLGLAPADYYRRLAAAEAAGERLAGLATGNFAQENIGELVAVLELFCGQEAGRRLSEAGVFFDHVEQTEMLQVFHALNAQRVRSHPLRTEEFSAMLRAFGRWQRAIAVYLDEYLPVQSLIDEAVDGYCAGRRFTFPALARANVARLLHYFFQKHVLDAQRLLRMGDAVTGLELRMDDIYKAREGADAVVARLGPGYYARDWMQMNRNLFKALKLERRVMFIILTLIVLVAAFNIASSLIMLVMGKTKDIAILKAMGATDRSIRKIFVFNGMVIGLIGTGLGLILAVAVCALLKRYNIHELTGDIYYFTTQLPVKMEALDVVSIVVAALVICFLATLYPARQAARLNPVEAIRYG